MTIMTGISENKDKRKWGLGVVILVGAGIIFVLWRPDHHTPPETIETPVVAKHPGNTAVSAPIPAVEKRKEHTREKPLLASQAPADDYVYPAEMEDVFIDEAMQTLPKLIEVEVHEPGVVFFRHEPDRRESLAFAMEDLAELYRTTLDYNASVNVVFFISGRPVKSKVFFRE